MIEKIEMYKATCNDCGDSFDPLWGDGKAYAENKRELEFDLMECGWLIGETGETVCYGCKKNTKIKERIIPDKPF